MRKLKIIEHISLDGVIQAPGGPEEDTGSGFKHGGWSAPHADPEAGKAIMKAHGELSICCWVAEPTISSAVFGLEPRRVRCLTV
jgi:hypothetical protein